MKKAAKRIDERKDRLHQLRYRRLVGRYVEIKKGIRYREKLRKGEESE